MLKLLIILYCTCYFCYIFYTREPDYFDSETTKGKVEWLNKNDYKITYSVNNKTYNISTTSHLKSYKVNDVVEVIYNPSKPQQSAIYTLLGYWFTINELLLSVVLLIATYYLSVMITSNGKK